MNLALLLATIAALLSGPALYALARERPPLLAFLDGFVLVSIAGLVLLEVVPGAFSAGGGWSTAFLLLGLLGPTLLEHAIARARREAHIATLALAIAGLVIHSVGDGAALSPAGGADHAALALAVAIHSVPVGLTVWWLLAPVFGARLPALAIAAMVLATVAGYVLAGAFSAALDSHAWAWFQALVAGSILHVVFGRPHLDEDSAHRHAPAPFEGLGNLAALVALALLGITHDEAVAGQLHLLDDLLRLALLAAPALLAGYLVSGWVATAMPASWLRWLGRGEPTLQALRGVALGLPLHLGSLGVLPVHRALVERGVALSASLAFLLATPALGLPMLFVSLALLGPQLTVLRIAGAIVLAVLVARVVARQAPALPLFTPIGSATAACDHPGHGHGHGHVHAPAPAAAPGRSLGARLRAALRSGLADQVDATAPWILAGLLVAALLEPITARAMAGTLPAGVDVLAFALLGLPAYAGAAGVTPLVAVLIAAGASPGAGLAFLLTGPACNLATLGLLRQLHGTRVATLVPATLVAGATLLGLAVNALSLELSPIVSGTPAEGGLLAWVSLLLLGILFAASLLRRGGRALLAEIFGGGHTHP